MAPPFVPAVSRGQTKRESKQRVAKELKSEGGLDLIGLGNKRRSLRDSTQTSLVFALLLLSRRWLFHPVYLSQRLEQECTTTLWLFQTMWAHDTPAVRIWVWFRVKVRNIEFKKRRRRRRGQRRLKNELIFYLRISRFSKVIILFLAVQAISKLHTEHSVKLDMEIQNISRHR